MRDIFKKQKLIISIQEARKMLGIEAKHLSDKDVEKIILDLTYLSNLIIEDQILERIN